MLHIDCESVRAAGRPATNVAVNRLLDTSAGMLEVATLGPDTGPALILMTHAMGSWSSLYPIGMQLAEQHPEIRIIAWSRPGCGNSPATAGLAETELLIDEARLVLPALMAALDIDSADFLGHADGATVALLFAALYPTRVGKVIAIAPYAFADDRLAVDILNLPSREADSGFSDRLDAHHADPEATYGRWRQRCLSDHAGGWSALGTLSTMTAPLLLVQGTADEFAAAGQVNAIASAVAGPVDWVLLRSHGHFLPRDIPEQVVCLVNGHLASSQRRLHG